MYNKKSSIKSALLLLFLLLGVIQCSPHGIVRTVTTLGIIGEQERRHAGIISQDGAQSIAIPGGSLWTFGDTILGSIDEKEKINVTSVLNNTMAITTDLDARDSISGFFYVTDKQCKLYQPITHGHQKDKANERLWPAHGIYYNGKIQMFYQIIEIVDPSSVFGFKVLGIGMAEANLPQDFIEKDSPKKKKPQLLFRRLTCQGKYLFWKEGEGGYGIQALDTGDGFIYVYGHYNRKKFVEEKDLGNPSDPMLHPLRLMRVKKESFTKREAYEYLADQKGTWTKNPRKAVDLLPVMGTFQIFYNKYLNAFLCIYTDDLSNRIKIRTAQSPWGPFGEPEVIFIHETKNIDEFISTMYVHPEYNKNEGRVFFVTYCVSTLDTQPILLKIKLR